MNVESMNEGINVMGDTEIWTSALSSGLAQGQWY